MMGGFYANVTLRTRSVDAALAWVREARVPAAVAFDGGHVVIADARLDAQDEDWLTHATVKLGSAANCFGLGALIHDDSILILSVTDGKNRVHRYNSCPAYFTGEGTACPTGGEAELFADAFGKKEAVSEIDRILNACDADGTDAKFPYVVEHRRHLDLCDALGLPKWSVFFSYEGLKVAPPDGFDETWLRHYGSF
jgi:hypothetical protein